MIAKPGRRFAFGARVALLAVLAQAIIPAVHHVRHGYPLIVAVIAAAADVAGTSADDRHEHRPANNHSPSPAGDSKTPPICPVCQSAQQLLAGLEPASVEVSTQIRHAAAMPVPRDAAATVARPYSSAQPRAPPTA